MSFEKPSMTSSSLCADLDSFRISSPVTLYLKPVPRGKFHGKLGRRWKGVSSHLNGTTVFERQHHRPLVISSRQKQRNRRKTRIGSENQKVVLQRIRLNSSYILVILLSILVTAWHSGVSISDCQQASWGMFSINSIGSQVVMQFSESCSKVARRLRTWEELKPLRGLTNCSFTFGYLTVEVMNTGLSLSGVSSWWNTLCCW